MLFSKSVFSLELNCDYQDTKGRKFDAVWSIEGNNFYLKWNDSKTNKDYKVKWGSITENELDYIVFTSKTRPNLKDEIFTQISNIIINKKTLKSYTMTFSAEDEKFEFSKGTCKSTN